MGCRCCFVANQLEELVGAGDSRSSSRVREHGSFLEVNVYLLALCEQTDGLSTFHSSICVYVFVCVFVFMYTFNRH